MLMWVNSGDRVTLASARCSLDHHPATPVTRLDLRGCGLATLPPSILRYTALTHLDLGGNQLRHLPPLPPSIEVLFLLGNQFEDVPVAVTPLHHLRMLSFKQCNLRRLGPTPLSTTLQWLILSNNQLTALPPWIATLTRVRKLM